MPQVTHRDPRTGQEEQIWSRNRLPLTCSGCHRTTDNHRLIRPNSGADFYYLSICRECERDRNRARRTDRVPTITSERLGDRRRFGVEIECHVQGGSDGPARQRIREALPTGWKVKGDGSLGYATGVEVVSPPLRGEAGLQQLRDVLAILQREGATIDRRCGLHVHHEVQDIGRDGLVLFVRSWAANQDLLDWLVSPSRRNGRNTYCRRFSDYELRALGTWRGGYNAPGERYRTVNVHAFPKYGTVEVRQHQGTLSFRKIEAWIKLAQAMLDSVAGRNRPHGNYGTLSSFLQNVGLDEDAGAYLLGRAVQFGAPASALHAGQAMSAEVNA